MLQRWGPGSVPRLGNCWLYGVLACLALPAAPGGPQSSSSAPVTQGACNPGLRHLLQLWVLIYLKDQGAAEVCLAQPGDSSVALSQGLTGDGVHSATCCVLWLSTMPRRWPAQTAFHVTSGGRAQAERAATGRPTHLPVSGEAVSSELPLRTARW